eukprot:10993189-Alexandrium_andersonii.AAC.1
MARPPAAWRSGSSRRSSASIRATLCFTGWSCIGSHTSQKRYPQSSVLRVTRHLAWCQRWHHA